MSDKNRVIVANITWNKYQWRKIYVDYRAGHEYARLHPGHESLNFEFNKKGLDNEQDVYGYFKWTRKPAKLSQNILIIFHSNNLEIHQKEVVGIYGDAQILENEKITKWNGFENDVLVSIMVAKKNLSLLFPIPLRSDRYSDGKKLDPQCGYTYKSTDFAKKVIEDEIIEIKRTGIGLNEITKLKNIYLFLTGSNYLEMNLPDVANTEEQDELLPLIQDSQTKDQIINDLESLTPRSPELVAIRGKQYKRDNKTIVQLKILRNFKCQICNTTIRKRNNTPYIEAAHITAKRSEGSETPDNILILCPNHHKEFDLGDKKIIRRSKDKIVFELNGIEHELSLKIR